MSETSEVRTYRMDVLINDTVDPPHTIPVWRKATDLPNVFYRDSKCMSPYRAGELVTWGYSRTWLGEPHFGQYDYVLGQYIS